MQPSLNTPADQLKITILTLQIFPISSKIVSKHFQPLYKTKTQNLKRKKHVLQIVKIHIHTISYSERVKPLNLSDARRIHSNKHTYTCTHHTTKL